MFAALLLAGAGVKTQLGDQGFLVCRICGQISSRVLHGGREVARKSVAALLYFPVLALPSIFHFSFTAMVEQPRSFSAFPPLN
jgi:hypothetical protein